MVTHPGARYAGPVWLAAGIVVYLLVRRARGSGLLERVGRVEQELPPRRDFRRILVPMKLGEIGEEMVTTAIELAQERDADVEALHVIRVPLDKPLERRAERHGGAAAASLAEAACSGPSTGSRSRRIAARTLDRLGDRRAAAETDADLIVLGSSPRWRRQSRFFSPTVEYVLRNAPCEVLVVAFPQGVLEDGAVG